MERILSLVPDSPLVAFTVLLLVTLTVPPIFERLRLPGLVGLLLAGVLLGPSLLGLLEPTGETEKLLSDIGKIYLMFVAGLEIDLREFRKTRNRSLGFGLFTFVLPLLTGLLIGRVFGYDWIGAVLIGSLLSSHTLLSYPIVMRLGVAKEESVTVTVGATIFTDIAALLVLAMCVAAQTGDFSLTTLGSQLVMLAAYAAAVLFGLDWAGRAYFRRTGDEQGNQFLFVLLAVFLAAVGSQLINVDKIVGAFLAGLAVNDVVGDGPVKEKIEFVGGVLFIPFFFICMGLLLDIPVFLEALTKNLGFTTALVGGLLASKWLAALLAKLIFGYRWSQMMTMWSLSLPQVAATLAAAVVGLQANIISPRVFNAVIVLMLATSLLGPLLTGRFARQIRSPHTVASQGRLDLWPEVKSTDVATLASPFTIVVPISNPLTQRYLIEMAALIARHEQGKIVPLTIAQSHVHMDDPQLMATIDHGRRLLQKAQSLSQEFDAYARPLLRVDDDVAEGISRTAREQNANLIVMGWSSEQGLRAKLFGTLTDSVFWSSHCPVAMTRLLAEPVDIHQVLVPVKNLTPQAMRTVHFAQLFAATHEAMITLLHVCDRRTPPDEITEFEAQIKAVLTAANGPAQISQVVAIASDDPAEAILEASQHYDMLVLRSMRRRTAGGLAVSDVTHQVIEQVNCSVVLFGEPHS